MKKIILILLLIVVLAGGYFAYQSWQKSNTAKKVSPEEKEFNESGQAKAILDETDLWQIYEDQKAGFSIKYPANVGFGENKNLPYLSVQIDPVDTLEGTMGYNKETALKNTESLKNGGYGQEVDWPLAESKTVEKIGSVNAQEFMVLSRFEICDVVFERKLYFFNNGYQVVITLAGPKDDIIKSAPEYFELNQANCGNEKIWNFAKQKDFFNNLKNNAGPQAAQEWFNLFNKIANTIVVSSVAGNNSDLLIGKWQSLDDAKSEIEFKDSKKMDYYAGNQINAGSYSVNQNHLTVTSDNVKYEYTIVELSDKALTLTYLERGNTLKYTKE